MQSYNRLNRKPFESTTVVYEGYERKRIKNQFSSGSHPIAESVSFNVSSATSGDFKSPTRHAFEKVTTQAHVGSMFESAYYGPDWFDTLSSGAFELVSGTTMPSSMIYTAQNRAYSKLMEQVRGNIDLSVDAFQMRQTKRMVADAADVLLDIKRKHDSDWLKREFKRFIRSPKKAGSKWLEFQYGWKPTAQTLYDTVQKSMSQTNEFIRVVARAREFQHSTEVSKSSTTTTVRNIEHSARCLYVVNLKLSNSVLQSLAGYSSLNPASIVWELTPYSFVVDWFVDVGSYLRNLESALVYSSSVHSGFSTVTTKSTVSSVITEQSSTPYYNKNGQRFGKWERVTKSRSPLYSMPLPNFPRFNASLGSARLLNAAALLSQHLR